MKHNLKNRPTLEKELSELPTFRVLEEWFRGFEAELREKYREHKEVGSIGANIIAEVYKEILGE